MNANEVIQDLRQTLKNTSDAGHEKVFIVSLQNYLDELEQRITTPFDQTEADRQHDLFKIRVEHDYVAAVKMFDSTIEAGLTSLKTATLINGGAAVALLAFVGNVVGKDDLLLSASLIPSMGEAMFSFIVGVACAGIATGARYITQLLGTTALSKPQDIQKKWLRCALISNAIAILLGIGAYVMFVRGGWLAYCTLLH